MQERKTQAVQCHLASGLIVIEYVQENIFRCIYTKKEDILPVSPLNIHTEPSTEFLVEEDETLLRIRSERMGLEIDKKSGAFFWKEADTGRVLLKEGPKELTEIPYMVYSTQGEEPVIRRVHTLYQHNMRTPIPFLISDKGYGILADCGSLMTFNDDNRGSYLYLDMVEQLDYYFIAGSCMDELIAGYRMLTGKAVMLPKWAFGYVQSKEAYHNQQELLAVATEYRKRNIPLDCIVQDWNTWEEGAWGNKKADKSRYPDIGAMNDELHRMHVHSMISVWPNMNSGTDNYLEMETKGFLLNDFSTYDAFCEEARKTYWQQAKEFFDGGFDAWWCDSTEPFSGPDWNGEFLREPWERFQLVGNEHKKFLKPDRANLYAVAHAKGIFENQRKECSTKRVLNLTRSGYASSQKYGTVLWSGDISATWAVFQKQIVEGLNMGLSGMPYWTLDAGAFFVVNENWQKRGCNCQNDPAPKWFWRGDYEEGVDDYGYRELYVRWLQYSAFLPMFRSHGTDVPREIWNFGEVGTPFYDAIAATITLRYRLMPYIYSMAGRVWREDYTMVRSLLFDFPEDKKAAAISSEFMFGGSLLVCPVTEAMYYERENRPVEHSRNWECYLPDGCDWYDFYTGVKYPGGRTVSVDVTLDAIPVFVKAGAIIPMEQGLQYAGEEVGTPLEIHIYPGADGSFLLYEDEGDGYTYEQGEYQTVSIRWEDAAERLTIGSAPRKYAQGILGRDCTLIVNGKEKHITYEGTEITVSFAE